VKSQPFVAQSASLLQPDVAQGPVGSLLDLEDILPSPFVLVAAHAAPIDIFAYSDGTNTHTADVRLGPGATTVGHPQRVNDLVDAE